MVKYYYDRYNAIEIKTYVDNATWRDSFTDKQSFSVLSKGYSFNPVTNTYHASGGTYAPLDSIAAGTIGYHAFGGNTIGRYVAQDVGLASDPILCRTDSKNGYENTYTTSYEKGSLVQSGIQAEDGTYPANGRHTDGYWYVKGTAVGPLPPGTVINQPYSTAGNGGRKLVRMSNGNMYAAVKRDTTSIAIYKSTNNGLSWSLFKTFMPEKPGDFSMVATSNNTLYVIYGYSNGYVNAIHFRDDGTQINASSIQLDNAQTALGNVSLAIDPTNGHLHAAWASKNATYPNSFNIRYAKSTDGGVTWGAVSTLTGNNTSGVNWNSSSIVIRNGFPIIFTAYNNSSSSANNIECFVFNGSTWDSRKIHIGGSYVQSYPSAVVDKDGVIHVVWQGLDATDTVKENIRYSKSIDNGVSWDVIKLTSGNTYSNYQPSISVDKSGKVVVVYSGVDTAISTSRDNIRARYLSGGIWSSAITLTSNTSNNAIYPSVLYDPFFSGNFGTVAPTIYQNAGVSVEYIGTYTTNNAPTVSLSSPSNNQTLYENDTLNISGNAYDSDKDQSVTAYYQINSEPKKVLATNLSQTQIALSKQLTFKGGKLYDGDTALTGTLADGVAHTLKVWAEDSEKASSANVERTFYVVPNRAPLLSVDAVVPSGVVDADKFKISGTVSDQDANSTVKVTRRINAGNAVEIYSGAGGAWEFELALSQLVVGQNTIVIEVIDNYGAKASKTITLNKKEVKTPILQSVARYKIEPPKGSAKGVLLFIQRDEELDVKVELSMTLSGEQEQYETLTPVNTAPVQQGVVEDTFEHEGLEAKQNIILKITPSRTDLSFNHKIHLISGAVD